MGLDVNSLNLLGFASRQGVDFTRTLSVGRAAVSMRDDDVIAFLRSFGRGDLEASVPRLTQSKYYEDIVREVFGASHLAAIDASTYEGASIVHDLNTRLDTPERFTAILDFGCLEHVFNFPVAIDNLIRLCEPGGHLLHYLPANNCCGHGFYQFSPELFFSTYAADRGFAGTRVFFVEWQDDPAVWFEVRSPIEVRHRVLLANRHEGYLLVITQRLESAVSPLDRAPQQSDYLKTWKAESTHVDEASRTVSSSIKAAVKGVLAALGLHATGQRWALRRALRRNLVRGSRPDVVPIAVKDLVR